MRLSINSISYHRARNTDTVTPKVKLPLRKTEYAAAPSAIPLGKDFFPGVIRGLLLKVGC